MFSITGALFTTTGGGASDGLFPAPLGAGATGGLVIAAGGAVTTGVRVIAAGGALTIGGLFPPVGIVAAGGLFAAADGAIAGVLVGADVGTPSRARDGMFVAVRVTDLGAVDRHHWLCSTRHPTTRPAATPVATAARDSVVFDAWLLRARSRLIGGGQSAAAAHASRSSATRSRNSSAGSGSSTALIPNSESSGSTSTSSRSMSGAVMLRSSGSPPHMHT